MSNENTIEVTLAGKPLFTPAKNPLKVPTKALAEAIEAEWRANGKFVGSKMPLSALAFTAIDRIAGRKDDIIEVLLVYVDTDTLSYRASGSQVLAKCQEEKWDPVLAWADKALGVQWQTTSGVMPVDQPPDVHKSLSKYLGGLTDMQLAAGSVLASSLSSLVLMLALLENHINAQQAFELSRLEEDYQAEKWGHDEEATQRADRLKAEILQTAHFLDLQRAA
jgi:chaperone required for assembly of F1-ATPase